MRQLSALLTPGEFPYLVGPRFHGNVPAAARARFYSIGRRGNVALGISAATPQAGEPVRLRFDMPYRHLEYVHDRPVHLIIVSEDLEDFQHIHPELMPDDGYEVMHTFARGGRYRLWADFSLPGEAPRVESFDVTISGGGALPPKTMESMRVELRPEVPLRSGLDIPIHLKISGDRNSMERYLGAWAHVIVVSEDGAIYAHAHPVETAVAMSAIHTHVTSGPPPEEVTITTSFPHAGTYRLWAQFQEAGQVHTLPFTLQVGEGSKKQTGNAIPDGAIPIRVGQRGYSPAVVEIPAGKAVTLAITRDMSPNCGSEIVFPALKIRTKLPPGKTTLVQLPAQRKGEIAFGCGMGMFRGMIVAR